MEQMLICLSLALIAGLLMSRAAKAVRLPAVTAYLLTGLLLGPFFLGRLGLSRFGFGFGSLAAVEGYGILTQVALGFIAFVIGNEFRLSALKHMGRRAVTVGVAQAVITTALVDIALVALHFARPDVISLASAITLGSIAAATAPAATLMVVKQYKADGPLTKLLLMVVAMFSLFCFPADKPCHVLHCSKCYSCTTSPLLRRNAQPALFIFVALDLTKSCLFQICQQHQYGLA